MVHTICNVKRENTGNGGKAADIIIKLLLTVTGSFVAFIIVCLLLFYTQLTPVQDVDTYAGIITEGRSNPHRQIYLSHFPDNIPLLSERTVFFFFPGFLQGSAIYRLRLVLPEDELLALEEELLSRSDVMAISFEDAQSFIGPGFPKFDHKRRLRGGLFQGFETITEDFDSFLVATTPDKIRVDWNHPEIGGFSISKERNEIVFWTEDG